MPHKHRRHAFVAVACVVIIVAYFIVKKYCGTGVALENIREYFDKLVGEKPVGAGAVFFLFTALAGAAGMSRLLLSALAGAIFGGWTGFALALPATLIGSWCVFSFGRLAGIERVKNLLGKRARHITDLPGEIGWIDVMVARQIPLPAPFINLSLAIAKTRTVPFIIGTMIGYLPGTLIATFLGNEALSVSGDHTGINYATVIMLGAGILIIWTRNKIRKRKTNTSDNQRNTI